MKGSVPNNEWKEWWQIAEDTLYIEDHLPISHLSRFGDEVWNFNDSNKPRTISKSPYELTVKWYEYTDVLPPAILRSIRVLGFFCVNYPSLISSQRKFAYQGLGPAYCCRLMHVSLSFFANLCAQAAMPLVGTTSPTNYIDTLADVTITDIQNAFPHWRTKSRINELRKVLEIFTIDFVQKHLPTQSAGGVSVGWNYHDIETADLPKALKVANGEKASFRKKPLPDDLFTFLVSTATKDVLSFLTCLGKTPCTPTTVANQHEILSNYTDFAELYEGYMEFLDKKHVQVCKKTADGRISQQYRSALEIEFHGKFGVYTQDVKETIERIKTAAKYLLLQFTGIRYSEAALLRKGCIIKLPGGDFVLRGTVVKGQSINLLTGLDHWVACPIVRDAVAVLEETMKSSECDYFFANNHRLVLKEADRPVKNTTFNNILAAYLYDVDSQRKYSVDGMPIKTRYKGVLVPYRPTSHRLRHTLALHMSRAGLGIPYISLHLKHVYQAHKQFQGGLQDVTLSYGGIGSDIFHDAVGIRQANREIVRAIYHPQAPVAGPGAQEFKQNRSYYFTGMLANGWKLEEILEHLAERGLPLADVGLGYCKGQRPIEENGIKKPPACLGQLQCNPGRCQNAIIPQSKIAMWIQLYKVNLERLNDPLLEHGHSEYTQFVEEAKQVLHALGIKVQEL